MDKKICEKCGAVLKHYDRVTRIIKGKGVLKVIFMWRDIDVQSVKLYIDFSQSVYIHISNTTRKLSTV